MLSTADLSPPGHPQVLEGPEEHPESPHNGREPLGLPTTCGAHTGVQSLAESPADPSTALIALRLQQAASHDSQSGDALEAEPGAQ
jgi:hypothetical protein